MTFMLPQLIHSAHPLAAAAPVNAPQSIWAGVSAFEIVLLIAGALLTIALAAFFFYLWWRGDRQTGDDPTNSDHG